MFQLRNTPRCSLARPDHLPESKNLQHSMKCGMFACLPKFVPPTRRSSICVSAWTLPRGTSGMVSSLFFLLFLHFSNTRTTSPRQRCQGRRYCCTTRLPQRHVKNRVASTRRRYRNKRIPDTLHALNVGYGSTSMTLRSQHRRSKNRRVHKAKRLTLTKKPS